MRDSRKPDRQQFLRGFTLVELLVVLLIVAVVASFSLPMIAKARRKALVAVSMSNIRQLAEGAMLYGTDNGGRLLPHAIFDPEINENREWCFAYGRKNSKEGFKAGVLGPYLSDAESVIQDPAWKVPADIEKALTRQGKPGAVGYGYNGFYLSEKIDVRNGHWQGYPLATVRKPERTVLFATSANKSGSRAVPSENIWSTTWAGEPCLRAVTDSGQALVAWVDGNVTLEKLRPDASKPDHQTLGWLQPTNTDDSDLFDRQ